MSEEEEKKLLFLKENEKKLYETPKIFRWELGVACESGWLKIVEWFMSPERTIQQENSKDPEVGMGFVIDHAIRGNHLVIIKYLLNESPIKPDQYNVNYALLSPASRCKQTIVGYLLNESPIKPVQCYVNYAFYKAARDDEQAMVEYLLSLNGSLRPDQAAIDEAYRDAMAYNRINIANLLRPRVSREERLNQHGDNGQWHNGMAFEIHKYADTIVKPQDNSNNVKESVSKPIKLIDAVFDSMQNRLKNKGTKLIAYHEAQIIIEQVIDKTLRENERANAKNAAFYRLGGEENYEDQIRLAVTFMQTFYPDKMQQWVQGFVGESITAYSNSNNKTSCSKGIRERIGTGLRGIDPELDKIFSQAEGPMLFKQWLKMWNLETASEQAKQNLASQLKAEKIGEKSTDEEVTQAFIRFLSKLDF